MGFKIPKYNHIKFETCKQVYAPAEDTFLVADDLLVHKGDIVLEIGIELAWWH